jgi:1,4-dihydroxy-2-naphthoate octaprenyltransferase
MPASSAPPAGFRLWLHAIRPRTLTLAVAPVLVGTALAWRQAGHVAAGPALAALLGAGAIQAATNLVNDWADGLRGDDRPDRIGPARVVASGWASAPKVLTAAVVASVLAGLSGLYLIAVGGWPILALGAASLLAGWGYSSGPQPISHTPLGEAFVVAFFGLAAVAGSTFLQTHGLSPAALLAGVALGLPAAAVLLVNNTRDRDDDRRSGRRTLAILAGRRACSLLYGALLLAPFPLLAALPKGALAGLAALPVALALVVRFARAQGGASFNRLLAGTSAFQLMLAALICLGWMII